MKKKNITVLVTGCAGFIGSNFVSTLRTKFPSATVVGIDNFATGRREAIHKDLIFYEGSVTNSALLDSIFEKTKPDYVVHFAALPRVSYSIEHPVETTVANIVGTVAILQAAHKHDVKRVVYSSSSAVYGGAKKLPTKESENPPNPISPYALQKYVGEPFCKMFSDLYGLDTIALRYFNVYGPGQFGDSPYSTVVSAWLEALYFPNPSKKPFLEGDGTQSRDFCYVDNVVQANIKAMLTLNPLQGEVFNVAHGERTTLREVQDLIEEYTGRKLDLEKRKPRMGDVAHTHADISKAKKWFGYSPEINFEEGLRRTVDWYERRVISG